MCAHATVLISRWKIDFQGHPFFLFLNLTWQIELGLIPKFQEQMCAEEEAWIRVRNSILED